jgi:putative FmdB family regulatory protein
MPLYEYECTACHRRTEKYSDADLTICPHCAGPLERTITAAAISFKGGGWYKDGYASAKPAAAGADGSAPSASSDSSPADKSSPDKSSPDKSSADSGSKASGDSGKAGESAKAATPPSVSPPAAPAATTKA